MVCVAIYAVLIQSIATDGDPMGAIWRYVGYTVLLCFSLSLRPGACQNPSSAPVKPAEGLRATLARGGRRTYAETL